MPNDEYDSILTNEVDRKIYYMAEEITALKRLEKKFDFIADVFMTVVITAATGYVGSTFIDWFPNMKTVIHGAGFILWIYLCISIRGTYQSFR